MTPTLARGRSLVLTFLPSPNRYLLGYVVQSPMLAVREFVRERAVRILACMYSSSPFCNARAVFPVVRPPGCMVARLHQDSPGLFPGLVGSWNTLCFPLYRGAGVQVESFGTHSCSFTSATLEWSGVWDQTRKERAQHSRRIETRDETRDAPQQPAVLRPCPYIFSSKSRQPRLHGNSSSCRSCTAAQLGTQGSGALPSWFPASLAGTLPFPTHLVAYPFPSVAPRKLPSKVVDRNAERGETTASFSMRCGAKKAAGGQSNILTVPTEQSYISPSSRAVPWILVLFLSGKTQPNGMFRSPYLSLGRLPTKYWRFPVLRHRTLSSKLQIPRDAHSSSTLGTLPPRDVVISAGTFCCK